ncbi:hypothetical protein Tco_1191747 [Tanacetum coccineum]
MESVKKSIDKRTLHQRWGIDAGWMKDRIIRIARDSRSKSGNDIDADDADIRPIYDEEPMDEVQLTAKCNVFATGQQHIEQPEFK